jgi:hypothetical protein
VRSAGGSDEALIAQPVDDLTSALPIAFHTYHEVEIGTVGQLSSGRLTGGL